jgi:hypothetical protein
MIFLKTEQIETAIRKMFSDGGYVTLSQVRNGTGFSKSPRTADMLAVSTWPSRGLHVEGIEIKVSRGDLQRELKKPEKSDDIARYCKHWWLAIPQDLDVGALIPSAWGVISVNEKLKAKVTRQASGLKAVKMDDLFVCSVLRNFSQNYIPISEVQPRVKAAIEEERRRIESSRSHRDTEQNSAIQVFKQHSGIDLMEARSWEVGNIGDAVKLITELRGRPAEDIQRSIVALEAALAALKSIGLVK